MPKKFPCDCGEPLRADKAEAGQTITCPRCGQENEIPDSGDDAVRSADSGPGVPGRRPEERVQRGRASAEDDRPRPAKSRTREWGDDDDEERPLPRDGKTSGKAIAALILGLLSFVTCMVTGLPAILFGYLGMRDVGQSHGRLKGQGLAVAGMVLGTLGLFACTPAILLGLLLPAVQKVRQAAVRLSSANNLHQIGVAMHSYHDTYGQFPTDAAIRDKNGKPLLSWRVAMLPYLEEDVLFKQFKLDEPWDSPHNSRLISQMPRVYLDPFRPDELAGGFTHYRVFVGPKTAFEPGKPMTFRQLTDGSANTIMVIETATAVPWTKPDEIVYDPKAPLPNWNNQGTGTVSVLMFDGAVRPVRLNGVSDQSWRSAITATGNDVVGPDW